MKTVVHLLRHGEVWNLRVLYGRRSGYPSDLGKQMAQRVADTVGDRDITHVVSSPLERAQETMAPLAVAGALASTRRIESTNVFEGETFGVGTACSASRAPGATCGTRSASWGEPTEVAARMMPRCSTPATPPRAAGRRGLHQCRSDHPAAWRTGPSCDPRQRQCTLCS
jgi:hypothetical protein